MNKNKQREYQKSQVQEDLYQFEMGNELGAQLEKNKEIHKTEYQKTSAEDHLDKMNDPYQNKKENE